jgi:hypothetical protein
VQAHAYAIAVQTADEIKPATAVIAHDLNFFDRRPVNIRALYPDLPRPFVAPIAAAVGTGVGRMATGCFALRFG